MIKVELNKNLCILAGIHAADGHFTRKGNFIIGDDDKNNIEIVANLIKKEFGFLPKIIKKKNENVYLIQFMNKKFYTFFKNNFNFSFGPKTYTVKMPEVITGNKILEKAFVKGAMTFESSVNTDKSIIFAVTSRAFRDNVASILSKNGINIKISNLIKEGNRKKQYSLRTSEILKSEELEKLLDCYIEGSEKWFKVLELLNCFFGKVKNIEDGKSTFRLTYSKGRKVQINNLIEIIKKLNQTDIAYLYKRLDIGKTTIMKYLTILKKSKIIKSTIRPFKLDIKYISKNIHITLTDSFRKKLFNRINKYCGHDAKICRLLDIGDYVYCRWKNGERGVPLDKLKVLLKFGKVFKRPCSNIKKVDREIISFNKRISEWRVPWRPWLNNLKLDVDNKGVKKWILKR